MSHKAIRDTILNHALTNLPAGITDQDIVFDGQSLDSQLGKSSFLAFYYAPVDAPRTAKNIESSKQNEGFFQISCYTARNDSAGGVTNYDNDLLALVDSIQSAFDQVNQITYNGQEVSITDVRANQMQYDDSYIKQDVTIDFIAYTARI
jgi:hypothetical protein